MTERERVSSENDWIKQKRHEIVSRPPQEHPIFPELAPPVQAYLDAEFRATRDDAPKEERKAASVEAAKHITIIFRDEKMLEDVTRYGEAVSDELKTLDRRFTS